MNNKLVEELREWAVGCHSQDEDGRAERCPGLAKFDEILSRHRPVKEEPLACLADRKGMRISKIENCHYPVGWLIHLTPKCITGNEPLWQRYDKTIEIPQGDNVDTYPAAESAARQYLLALPDKGEAR